MSFVALGNWMASKPPELEAAKVQAFLHNNWFTKENSGLAIDALAREYLAEEKLRNWLANYTVKAEGKSKTVGLIMAGNIPLVGFHDFLAVLITGNKALIKLSSKDNKIWPAIFEKLIDINPAFSDLLEVTERFKDFDAVIATGSNSSAKYFEQYFGKYPNIIRKNRNAVAILEGNESNEQLELLFSDIFQFFGLGCRSVSKVYFPKGYDLPNFLDVSYCFKHIDAHNKYKNNYDYNRTILIMNQSDHLANEFLMIKENEEIASPIACLNYEFYERKDDLLKQLQLQSEEIQCIVGVDIPFGNAQKPELMDYADGVDTLAWLLTLQN